MYVEKRIVARPFLNSLFVLGLGFSRFGTPIVVV